MRQLIVLLFAMSAIAGCGLNENEYRRVDERFGLCMQLPEDSVYHALSERADFNIGQLVIDGAEVEVYIGFQPQFPDKSLSNRAFSLDEFVYVGKDRQPGIEKILLAHKRYPNRGPLFVMFKGKNLSEVESTLVGNGFVTSCGASRW